jgi:hypothetical protein
VRTHSLSSGDRVWDLGGDLYHWVDAEEDGTTMSNPGSSSSKIYEKTPENSTVSNGDGLGRTESFIDSYAAIRGGYWVYGDLAGVFMADSIAADASNTDLGFRCSAVPVR